MHRDFPADNAAKVAKALLLIIVAMWISYQFNLNAISFILNKAVELGLLALVVIFQPGDSPVFGAHWQQQRLPNLPLFPE